MAQLRNKKSSLKADVWMRYRHRYDGAALACNVCKTIWKEGRTFAMEDYMQSFDTNRRCNKCGSRQWVILEGDYY